MDSEPLKLTRTNNLVSVEHGQKRRRVDGNLLQCRPFFLSLSRTVHKVSRKGSIPPILHFGDTYQQVLHLAMLISTMCIEFFFQIESYLLFSRWFLPLVFSEGLRKFLDHQRGFVLDLARKTSCWDVVVIMSN